MNDLTQFIIDLEGNFSNERQFNKLSEEQRKKFPYAVHRNHILNQKVKNKPKNFEGVFFHEESYYTMNDSERFKSDIFLFELNSEEKVVLYSISVPKKYENKKYSEITMIDFEDLNVSEKFNPIIYEKKDGLFIGQSESMFTSSTKFILKQKISNEKLVIKEEMKKGDKRIFGFDDPIIYEKI
ncbi:hypothetical protein [Enterococcus alishanensis]